jgi:hypothetical protein
MGQKAFLYAIVNPQGKPHLGEKAVAESRDELRDEVDALNDEFQGNGKTGYKIVPLYIKENR